MPDNHRTAYHARDRKHAVINHKTASPYRARHDRRRACGHYIIFNFI
ncbi:hypothetical protein BN129_1144 [Cronobacter sakazakii 701]|nr:hypothetical protein BN129_1144 [Cronobacter sakazakii 701]